MRRASEETLTSGTRGAWLTTDRFISSLSQSPCKGFHHTRSSQGVLRQTYTRTRLESAFSERAGSSQNITGRLACRNDMHNHFPSSTRLVLNAMEEVAWMAQSRWKAMGNRWELFQRQTEMCFKKHRVINKPNDSKFRRMADDTEEETKGYRGPRLTVCPLHLKPKHLVRCGHPLQHDSILWLQTLWMNGVQEAVPTGFGQVRSTHSQQQEQNAVMTFPIRTVNAKRLHPQWKKHKPRITANLIGFHCIWFQRNFLDNTPSLQTGWEVGGSTPDN